MYCFRIVLLDSVMMLLGDVTILENKWSKKNSRGKKANTEDKMTYETFSRWNYFYHSKMGKRYIFRGKFRSKIATSLSHFCTFDIIHIQIYGSLKNKRIKTHSDKQKHKSFFRTDRKREVHKEISTNVHTLDQEQRTCATLRTQPILKNK